MYAYDDTATSTPERRNPRTRTPKVLCIDDDPQVSEVIQYRLADYDVVVLRAYFGTQGIWLAVTQDPDVIITDLRMPQGDGGTVIECLKRNRQTACTPIIVLTGRDEPGLQRKMKENGADGYLVKPVHFSDLLRELQQFVELRPKPYDVP